MFPSADNIRRGNKMSRERMSILYDHSQYLKAIVIGTTNKTEYLLGYGTVYGDSACGINPIGDLYKTHIRQMAIEYGIPEEIINKKPSADLWCGQTDEDELGFKYEDVDKLLFLMIEKKYSINKLIDCGFSKDFIKKVTYLIRKNAFKRHTPPIPRVR
jgi:NAD+ synthase